EGDARWNSGQTLSDCRTTLKLGPSSTTNARAAPSCLRGRGGAGFGKAQGRMTAMESKTRHGKQVVEQFTRQARGYAEMTEKYGSGYDPLDLIDVGPDDIVLDVACGTGRLTLPLAATARHVTGFDITPAMVDIARKAQADAGVTNIDWQIGNVHALPFPDHA